MPFCLGPERVVLVGKAKENSKRNFELVGN